MISAGHFSWPRIARELDTWSEYLRGLCHHLVLQCRAGGVTKALNPAVCQPQVLQENKLPWDNSFPFQKWWKVGRAPSRDSYQEFVSKTTGLFEGEEGRELVLVEDLGGFGVKEEWRDSSHFLPPPHSHEHNTLLRHWTEQMSSARPHFIAFS